MTKMRLFGVWALLLASAGAVWAETAAEIVNPSYQKGLALSNRGDSIGAMVYFEQAAEQGVVEAQRQLGYILWKGGADQQQAARWLRAAAVAGDNDAQGYYLSLLREHVASPIGRSAAARGWLEQRSALDNPAKMVLARSFEGDDDAQALRLYQELADVGVKAAIKRLIGVYWYGQLGVPVDQARADNLNEQLQ